MVREEEVEWVASDARNDNFNWKVLNVERLLINEPLLTVGCFYLSAQNRRFIAVTLNSTKGRCFSLGSCKSLDRLERGECIF